MASKYNNLTRLYRVNIQRKNSVSRKQAPRGAPPLPAQPEINPIVPTVAHLPATGVATK